MEESCTSLLEGGTEPLVKALPPAQPWKQRLPRVQRPWNRHSLSEGQSHSSEAFMASARYSQLRQSFRLGSFAPVAAPLGAGPAVHGTPAARAQQCSVATQLPPGSPEQRLGCQVFWAAAKGMVKGTELSRQPSCGSWAPRAAGTGPWSQSSVVASRQQVSCRSSARNAPRPPGAPGPLNCSSSRAPGQGLAEVCGPLCSHGTAPGRLSGGAPSGTRPQSL